MHSHIFRPVLLGCDEKGKGKADPIQVESLGKSGGAGSIDAKAQQEAEPHQDERQVHLDVLRSFVSFPTGERGQGLVHGRGALTLARQISRVFKRMH